MTTPTPDGQPLHELKHEAVPGYMKAFLIAFTLMSLYLAVILISSPGKVTHHEKGHGDKEAPAGENY